MTTAQQACLGHCGVGCARCDVGGAAGAAWGPAASWSGLGTRSRCERDVCRRACGRASGPLQPGGDKGMRCGQPASRVLSGRASRPYMRVWDQVRGGQLEDWST
jgi:hypothetical protein